MTNRVLIADDHALFRAGIRELMHVVFSDVHIEEVDSYQGALNVLKDGITFDLALVDLCMPDLKGFFSLQSLLDSAPSVPFVVLSASNNPDDIRKSFDCGVMGYVPKSESSPVISNALQLVLSGGIYVPPIMLSAESRYGSNQYSVKTKLTRKQNFVFECLVKGRSNKEIAGELHMSEATVKAHITGIFKSLNVSNRTQAVLFANQLHVNTSSHALLN